MMYRVKQISEKRFIAQCKRYWIYRWESIDSESNYTWIINTHQVQHHSLEQAKKTIDRYKEFLDKAKQYPKYFKV